MLVSLLIEIKMTKILIHLFIAAERPRPSPRICHCENGGICMEPEAGNDLVCECPQDFSGGRCEVYSKWISGSGSTSAAAIYVPVLLVIMILAAIGVFYVAKKRPL